MANSEYTNETQDEIIGSYELANGVIVSIKAGYAAEYADMVAGQLHGITLVTEESELDEWNDQIKNNVRWLMSGLAGQLTKLLPIVQDDAERSLLERQTKEAEAAAVPPATRLNEDRSEMLLKFIEQLSREQEAENQAA